MGEDAKNGSPALSPDGLPNDFDYYKTERGFHPRSINSNGYWTLTTEISLMNIPILSYIKEISPGPLLLIAGSDTCSLYFRKDVYESSAESEELMIIPGAVHTDLYDGEEKKLYPFRQIEQLFQREP